MLEIQQVLTAAYLNALSNYERITSLTIALAATVDTKNDNSAGQQIDQMLFRWHRSLLRLLVAWNDLNRSGFAFNP